MQPRYNSTVLQYVVAFRQGVHSHLSVLTASGDDFLLWLNRAVRRTRVESFLSGVCKHAHFQEYIRLELTAPENNMMFLNQREVWGRASKLC